MTSFFIFDNIIEIRFLVCQLHTNRVIQSMTSSIVINSQGVFVVQISTLYHVGNLRYQGGSTLLPLQEYYNTKKCTIEGLTINYCGYDIKYVSFIITVQFANNINVFVTQYIKKSTTCCLCLIMSLFSSFIVTLCSVT